MSSCFVPADTKLLCQIWSFGCKSVKTFREKLLLMVSYFLLTQQLQSFDLSYLLHIVIIHKGHLLCGNCTDCWKCPLQLVLHQTISILHKTSWIIAWSRLEGVPTQGQTTRGELNPHKHFEAQTEGCLANIHPKISINTFFFPSLVQKKTKIKQKITLIYHHFNNERWLNETPSIKKKCW